jgi:hypothetical protein
MLGMVAAAEDLQIGSAGQRRCHADDHFARPGLRHRDLLDAHVLFAVEHGSGHQGVAGLARTVEGTCYRALRAWSIQARS